MIAAAIPARVSIDELFKGRRGRLAVASPEIIAALGKLKLSQAPAVMLSLPEDVVEVAYRQIARPLDSDSDAVAELVRARDVLRTAIAKRKTAEEAARKRVAAEIARRAL